MKHGRVILADSHLNMLGGVHSLLDALFETVLMVANDGSRLLRDGPADPAWLAAILESARERCVWGSDWPHTPAHDAQQGPDVAGVYRPLSYAAMVDNFTGALQSDELAAMILDGNPARLYEFDET